MFIFLVVSVIHTSQKVDSLATFFKFVKLAIIVFKLVQDQEYRMGTLYYFQMEALVPQHQVQISGPGRLLQISIIPQMVERQN